MATYYNKANYEWLLKLKDGRSFKIVIGVNTNEDLPEGLERKFPLLKTVELPKVEEKPVFVNTPNEEKIDTPEHFNTDITVREFEQEEVKSKKSKKSKKK